MDRLGAAPLEGPGHVESPGIVAAWGGDEPHENDFLFSPYGRGWHLDRRRFDEALARAAADAGAGLITAARAVECRRGADETWRVTLATDRGPVDVLTRWVVDATGRSAWFARRRGVARQAFDRLVGHVGVFDDRERPDPRTFLEAAEDGWWYAAALPGGRAIAVYFTDADLGGVRPGAVTSLWGRRLGSSRMVADRLATRAESGRSGRSRPPARSPIE